jgi:xylan 1,4-beta-xylosidase
MTLSIAHASRAVRVLVFACAAIAAGGSAYSAGRARASTPATFTPTASVDFAHSVKVRSLVGFLHGLSDSQPPDRLVVPLHPTLWRGSLASASYDRATALGARYMLVVSDLWGYPGADWYGRQAPWTDWDAWSGFVRRLAIENRSRRLIWDVWNEPDWPYFWTGSEAQYHELYRRAYVAIRQELGRDAIIAGPSVSVFRWDWLTRLLEFCRFADCEVDALSWHELPGGRSITSIGDHVRRARLALLHNPAFAPIGLRELDISEYVGQADALYGAETLGYVAQLERQGVRRAAHACWQEPSGTDDCHEDTLDGLLTGRSLRPRAAWWALRWYARGTASRVRSQSADPALAVMAARAVDRQHAEIEVGYLNTHDRPLPAQTDVLLELSGLGHLPFARNGRVRFFAYRVRSTGEAPTAPIAMRPPSVERVAPGRLAVRVHAVGLHDTILLRLSAPGRRQRR